MSGLTTILLAVTVVTAVALPPPHRSLLPPHQTTPDKQTTPALPEDPQTGGQVTSGPLIEPSPQKPAITDKQVKSALTSPFIKSPAVQTSDEQMTGAPLKDRLYVQPPVAPSDRQVILPRQKRQWSGVMACVTCGVARCPPGMYPVNIGVTICRKKRRG